jgi:hypothetical protein
MESPIKRRQLLACRKNDEVRVTIGSWLRANGLQCVMQLGQVSALQLQHMFAGLKQLSEPEPASGLIRHLDVSAENEGNRMSIGERLQPRNAADVFRPLVDDQESGIERVAGEQYLSPAVVDRDVGRFVPRYRDHVEHTVVEIDGSRALGPVW